VLISAEIEANYDENKARAPFHINRDFGALSLAESGLPARRARLVVDDDKVECPNAAFSHIQDAVDAASPGDEIHICKGNLCGAGYDSQAGGHRRDNGAVLMPSTMQPNTKEPLRRRSHRHRVARRGYHWRIHFWTDRRWLNNGISACARTSLAFSFQNASGGLDHIAVRNFKLAHHSMAARAVRASLCKAAMEAPQVSKSTIAPFTTSEKRYHCR